MEEGFPLFRNAGSLTANRPVAGVDLLAKLLRIVTLAFSYLSLVVGVGFASGRETYQFFLRHGDVAVAGAATAVTLFVLGSLRFLALARRFKARRLATLLESAFGPFAPHVECLFQLAAFATLAVILAGGQELLGPLPAALRHLLLPLAAALAVSRGVAAVQRIQTGLVFLLLMGLLLVAFSVTGGESTRVSLTVGPWLSDASLYAAYNLFLALPYLLVVQPGATTSEERLALFLAGGVLFLLLFLMLSALRPQAMALGDEAIPLLRQARAGGTPLAFGYAVVLLGATFASAIGYLTALTERLAKWGRLPSRWVPYVLALATVPLSHLGLVALIGHLYPIMGVVALLLLVWLLARPSPSVRLR